MMHPETDGAALCAMRLDVDSRLGTGGACFHVGIAPLILAYDFDKMSNAANHMVG